MQGGCAHGALDFKDQIADFSLSVFLRVSSAMRVDLFNRTASVTEIMLMNFDRAACYLTSCPTMPPFDSLEIIYIQGKKQILTIGIALYTFVLTFYVQNWFLLIKQRGRNAKIMSIAQKNLPKKKILSVSY